MAKREILREMFIKIGLIGDKTARKNLKNLKYKFGEISDAAKAMQKKIGGLSMKRSWSGFRGYIDRTMKKFRKFRQENQLVRKGINKLVGNLKLFQATLAALAVAKFFQSINLAIQSTIDLFKRLVVESSNLAATQEDAENRLRSALEIAGDFSESEFEGFKRFASDLQQVSTVGDEAILMALSLTKAFGATNDQAKELVKASINLASATGKSLEESVRQTAKTLGGFAGELGELNPAIKALTQEELKAGKAAEILNKQYGGIAQKNIRSFSAQFIQLKNVIGDAFEQIGTPLNEALLPFIRQLKIDIVTLGPSFTALGRKIAEAFKVVVRIFESLGGRKFLDDALSNIGDFVVDIALLFEDLFYFIRGERSFLGKVLDVDLGSGIAENLADLVRGIAFQIGKLVVKLLPTILWETLKALFFYMKGLYTTLFNDVIKAFFSWQLDLIGKIISSLGNFFSGLDFFKDDGSVANQKSSLETLKKYSFLGSPAPANNNVNNTVNQTNTITTNQTSQAIIDQLNMAQKEFKFAEGVR